MSRASTVRKAARTASAADAALFAPSGELLSKEAKHGSIKL